MQVGSIKHLVMFCSRRSSANTQDPPKILSSGTRHIVFLNSHFFNIEDIGVNTYKSILNEIANAVATLKEHEEEHNCSNVTPIYKS
jgi:hypothetical protein